MLARLYSFATANSLSPQAFKLKIPHAEPFFVDEIVLR